MKYVCVRVLHDLHPKELDESVCVDARRTDRKDFEHKAGYVWSMFLMSGGVRLNTCVQSRFGILCVCCT